MANKKKDDRKGLIASLIAVIVLLSTTLTVSIIYNLVGGFYNARVASFEKVLGEEQTIEIEDAGAYVCSMNFTGTLVINTDINQEIFIKNGKNPLYLRAKMSLVKQDSCGIIFGFSNWVMADDGYIYLNQAVAEFENLGLCKYVRFDDDLNLISHKDYILTVIVEASESPYQYNPI